MALWVTNLFLSVQREEKQLEASLDALLSQVADLKNSLGSFIYKLENEYDRLTWPSVLDSFALLSGQLNTLNKVLKHEKTPLFRNQVIIPLVLSPDRDEDLMRQTEGRVPVFSHEVVPDHLRTKPDPEVEEQEKQLTTDAARVGADAAQKQIQSLNKMCSNLLEKISKEERESESGGKMPSGIKTNIKSASMHPYQRVPSWVGLRRTEDVLVALVDSHWRSQNEAERQEEARCTSGEPGPAQGDPMEPAARCRGKGWGVLAGRASCPGIWRPAPAPAPRAEPSRGQSAGAPRPARPVPLW
ncbi:mediator of RNA polymerase II transcription subunit 8 isoform X5 [Phoca vitulina]|uniref:mediator of RNA polymerase II transcription subunit 8 isoform X5 n=1 Tax=Phoca vitulina TaxID=9720 RepID=UPI0013965C09|nr:mediator of RNA polymerase II transcription subunit 8 isoform X5 [Phoca vitulina]